MNSISDMVFEAIDRKQITALMLLDLSKAFDTIDHEILLSKLRVLARGAIEWFRSYLSDIARCVRFGTKCRIPGKGSLRQINRAKHLFDRSTLITIINGLVFSKMFYCSSVLAGATKKGIERLQKLQNFAVRIVTGERKFDDITPYLKDLHWVPGAMQLEVRNIIMT